jgi:hypothetical protein
MSDGPLNFEEHRRRRDENASTVRCARCREWIVATATKCPECGVHFRGEAQDFAPGEGSAGERGTPRWVVVVALLLMLAMLVGVLGVR